MAVLRIVTNVEAADPSAAKLFYQDILGLAPVMDHGWIVTYGLPVQMPVQISFASSGGSDTAVPDISIEVDNIDDIHRKLREAGFAIAYGPENEPWGYAASTSQILSASSSTSWSTRRPIDNRSTAHAVNLVAACRAIERRDGSGKALCLQS